MLKTGVFVFKIVSRYPGTHEPWPTPDSEAKVAEIASEIVKFSGVLTNKRCVIYYINLPQAKIYQIF